MSLPVHNYIISGARPQTWRVKWLSAFSTSPATISSLLEWKLPQSATVALSQFIRWRAIHGYHL